MTRLAIAGLKIDSPSATARIARAELLLSRPLEHVAVRAARSAAKTELSSSNIVSTSTRTCGRGRDDAARRLDTAEPRHLQVHDDDVGRKLDGCCERLLAVLGLGDDLDASRRAIRAGRAAPPGTPGGRRRSSSRRGSPLMRPAAAAAASVDVRPPPAGLVIATCRRPRRRARASTAGRRRAAVRRIPRPSSSTRRCSASSARSRTIAQVARARDGVPRWRPPPARCAARRPQRPPGSAGSSPGASSESTQAASRRWREAVDPLADRPDEPELVERRRAHS